MARLEPSTRILATRSAVGIKRVIPFPALGLADEFEKEIMSAIRDALIRRMDERIPPENNHFLVHGSQWTHERENGQPAAGGFERRETHVEISTQDIVDGDLLAIQRFAAELVDKYDAEIARGFYAMAGRAAEEVGNAVSGSEMGFPQSFLEMLRRIEFGVDRDGNVTPPEFHLHPDAAEKLIPILEAQGLEFQEEVDRLTAEKEAAALAREAERRSRFRTNTSASG